MLDLDSDRRYRGRLPSRVDRFRPILFTAVLVVGSLIVVSADDRPVFADHGDAAWPNSGRTGYWNGQAWRCESGPQIVIYAPDVLGASYVKDDATQSQLVYWTPRIWWMDPDGSFHHNYVDTERSDQGWYWAWVRPGDSHGGLIAYPERGSTFGGAGTVAWTDMNGVTQTARPFTKAVTPDITTSKVFFVEFIFYWASNSEQPEDGWLSAWANSADDFGGLHQTCEYI